MALGASSVGLTCQGRGEPVAAGGLTPAEKAKLARLPFVAHGFMESEFVEVVPL